MRYCSINWAAYSIVASGVTVTTKDVIIISRFFNARLSSAGEIIRPWQAGIDPDQFEDLQLQEHASRDRGQNVGS